MKTSFIYIIKYQEKAVKEIANRFLQEKAENDKEIAKLKAIINDLHKKLGEKDNELEYNKKRNEEATKKSPIKTIPIQYFEDENKLLQQEKKNLEGKIMQLLMENEKMKKKFDDVLQENSAIRDQSRNNVSPNKPKPENDVNFIYKIKNIMNFRTTSKTL